MSIDFSSVKSWNIPEGEVLSASLNGVQVWEKQSPTPTPAITADVTFIDYDGTILYEYTAADFLNLSALPATKDHTSLGDGLKTGSWNWTLSNAKKQVQNCGKVIIGEYYTNFDRISTLSSGTCKSIIYMKDVDSIVELGFLVQANTTSALGYVYIDWGDNSQIETISVSYTQYQTKKLSHTYSQRGDYVINISYYRSSIRAVPISGAEQGTSSQTCPLGSGTDTDGIAFIDKVIKMYSYLEGPKDTTTSNPATMIDSFRNLEYYTTDNLLASGGVANKFNNCSKLKALVSIPNSSIAWKGIQMLNNTSSLKVFSFPQNIDGNYSAQICNNSGIQQIYFHFQVYNIQNSCNNCNSLKEVILPYSSISSVTVNINSSFKDCSALQTLKFTSTKSSSMYNITNDSFQNLPTTCKIYVPSAKMADYKALSGMPDPTVYEYIGY